MLAESRHRRCKLLRHPAYAGVEIPQAPHDIRCPATSTSRLAIFKELNCV
jgi:hypothetical protein